MNDREQKLAYLAMSNTSDVCYIIDIETHEVIFINKAAKNLLGIKVEDYIGRKCYEIINGKSEICSFCTNQLLKEDKWEMFNSLLQRYFVMTEMIVDLDGRKVKLLIGEDINDSKNILSQLESKLTLEETLIRCVQTLSEEKSSELAINNRRIL